ncbi:tail assembly chaperone [Microbacterium phage Jehoshaphat]|nr:tail assembly chaperone [Microbacterium phage Casend]QWY80419.1 tail assembly chaperone [Microbacterium phage Teehee]QXN73430.1 tail assembly chaperone [Microbacterium phage Jehoshaphat]
MAKMAFQVAAKEQLNEEQRAALAKQEPWFEFSLLGQDFIVREKPSPAQGAVLLAALADNGPDFYAGVLGYIESVVEKGRGRLIRKMLAQDAITFGVVWGGDEQNPQGIVDTIISLASGNPTDEPNGSSTSQSSTSKRSTGALAGQGVDPFRDLSLRQFLNYVYTWYIERLARVEDGPAKVERWIEWLDSPYWSNTPAAKAAIYQRQAEKFDDAMRDD